MADPNLLDFYNRLQRLHEGRRGSGGSGGFDPAGAPGRGRSVRRAPRLLRMGKPIVIILLALLGLKSVIYSEIGGGNYADRVAQLQAGGAIARAGAVLMTADPLTVYIAGLVNQMRR